MNEVQKKKSPAEVLSIVSLIVVISAIPLAILFDVISLRYVILQFIACLIVPVLAFFVLFVAMIASLILIFGIFLLEQNGFWPLSVSIGLFKDMLGSITISQQEIDLFKIFRIILIVICLSVFILSIVSRALDKANANIEERPIKREIKGRTKASIILSILGMIVSTGALILTSSI